MNLLHFRARLAANADVFSALVRGMSREQAIWKPAHQKWSVVEVVNHLADEEVEDFRRRVDYTLNAPDREWPPIDPEGWVVSRDYASRSLAESLERFLKERRVSTEWLESLAARDWNCTHVHPKFGPIRAGDLLASWLEHDFIHIRQILTLQREFHRRQAAQYDTRYAGEW